MEKEAQTMLSVGKEEQPAGGKLEGRGKGGGASGIRKRGSLILSGRRGKKKIYPSGWSHARKILSTEILIRTFLTRKKKKKKGRNYLSGKEKGVFWHDTPNKNAYRKEKKKKKGKITGWRSGGKNNLEGRERREALLL